MTKYEEVVEVFARNYLFPWVHSTGAKWDKMPEVVRVGYRYRAKELLKYLHKSGYSVPNES